MEETQQPTTSGYRGGEDGLNFTGQRAVLSIVAVLFCTVGVLALVVLLKG